MQRLEDLPPDQVAAAVSKAVVDAVAEGGGVDAIARRALEAAKRDLGIAESPRAPAEARRSVADPGASVPQHRPAALRRGSSGRAVVTEDDVVDAARAGRDRLVVPGGALVTPLARDTAKDRGVRLVEG